ncbi:MAG: hypothetical protein QXY40_02460 [Candidatus Methanomethylicia archaeon]
MIIKISISSKVKTRFPDLKLVALIIENVKVEGTSNHTLYILMEIVNKLRNTISSIKE